METTGDRIRKARLDAHMTQSELADKIGVKHSAIHKYESGLVVNLKRETIAALAKALDVKPSWLMCLDDQKAVAPVETDITPNERELLTLYRLATDDDKAVIDTVLRKYKNVEKKEKRA